ncbi:MAG: hypothetical protein DRP56_01855 [Planctomycetota bacterium]|nr:MAG: hypothetical protein DRP56_01855 [Planctomycetota bacterium]RKY11495.1 MAG: hypothetical protein DRP52_05865 [Planctomycetota bacterium]
MKIDPKNPNVYYIAAPVLAGLWAILAVFVFFPSSTDAWEKEQSDFESVAKQIKQLATLQPKRLAYKVDEKAKPEDFDFTKTINEFARIFSISDSNYNLTVRGRTKRAGRQTRSATIVIKTIDTEKLAQFLSAMLLRWPELKCEVLSFEKVKNTKNNWKVNISLTYYY